MAWGLGRVGWGTCNLKQFYLKGYDMVWVLGQVGWSKKVYPACNLMLLYRARVWVVVWVWGKIVHVTCNLK